MNVFLTIDLQIYKILTDTTCRPSISNRYYM